MVDLSKLDSFDTGIPADVDMPPLVSDDPVCQVCGVPLTYGGRGRKPKFCDDHKQTKTTSGSGRKTAGAGTVDAAMASLEFCEGIFSIALLMASPAAAVQWSASLPELRAKNRAILNGNPALCKSIAKTSSKVSPYMLLGSYGYALAPVAKTVLNDMRARKPKAQDPAGWVPDDGSMSNVVDVDEILKSRA